MNTKKILKITANILIWLIFALSLFTVISSFNVDQGIANVFGLGYLSVQSDSMKPVFEKGDLLFVHATDANDVFEVDDVVSFHSIINGLNTFNTHRIISYETIGDTRYYSTQGDNITQSDLATITAGDIVAEYTGHKISGFGTIADFVQSQIGFLICVVLPLAAIFIYQIIKFSSLIAKYKKEGNIYINDMSEEQKAEIAKKYLASLEAKKKEENPTT